MPNIRNSAKAMIIRDGMMLCIECQDRFGTFYLLPGGGQEHGETLIEALQRECREEIGAEVVVRDLRFIREYLGINHEFANHDGDVHQIEFMFVCELADGASPGPGVLPDPAQTGVAWLPIDHLGDFRLYPGALKDILPQAVEDGFAGVAPVVYLGDVN